MGTGFTLEIPYDQLLLLVMGLFMFIGATRGLYREFITTCGLVVLLAFLIKPELAAPIIDYISKFLRLVLAFIQARGTLDFRELMAKYEAIKLPFDAQNPYVLLIVALVGFVLVSYTTRGFNKSDTALSRILGGLLGLFNGFLVISLVKEYVIKYVEQRTPAVAAAGPPPQVSVAVRGLPAHWPLTGDGEQFLAVLLGLVALIVLSGRVVAKKVVKKG